MSVNVELLPENILLLTYDASLDPDDLRYIETESVKLTKELDGPIYRINDQRNLKLAFKDLMPLMFDAARSSRNRPGAVGDPKFKEVVIVTPGTLAAFGAKSMREFRFGGFDLPVFHTLEEALDFAKEHTAK